MERDEAIEARAVARAKESEERLARDIAGIRSFFTKVFVGVVVIVLAQAAMRWLW